MVCLNKFFKFFKGCLPQILLGPFLNTLSQMLILTILSFRILSNTRSRITSLIKFLRQLLLQLNNLNKTFRTTGLKQTGLIKIQIYSATYIVYIYDLSTDWALVKGEILYQCGK